MFTAAPSLSARECLERVRTGDALLIDVREAREWGDGVADRAVLLPLSDLTGNRAHWQAFLAANPNRELLCYCRMGGRSALAARILASEGFKGVNVGSVGEWSATGWPIVPPAPRP
ncbi:MAG: hypothetical protein RIQ93_1453 [Verrucomicrobiota bacterium]|jgi:rhodanese-related sulfurtransferase